MKKYPISKSYIGVYLLGLLFCLIPTALMTIGMVQWIRDDCLIPEMVIAYTIGLGSSVLCAYLLFFDTLTGTISFNAEKVTMRAGIKRHDLFWPDLNDYGLIMVNIGSAGNPTPTFWVYCSHKPLTMREKKLFLFRTRHKLKDMVAYFEYQEEPFQEMLQYIPAEWRERLCNEIDAAHTPASMARPKPQISCKPIKYKKKYPISRNGLVFVLMGLIFFLGLQIDMLGTWLQSIQEDGFLTAYSMFNLLVLFVVLVCAKWTFFEFHNGAVRMDAEGITIRVGLKKRKHLWKDIVEYDIVPVSFSHTSNSPMFWVYASERPLTPYEKTHFKRLRHDLKELAYFECKPGPFYELLRYIPPEWQDKLREKVT